VCLLITELKTTGTSHHFSSLLNTTDYRILRMDEDHDRMYVGSKDYILSLDLHDINKEPLIIHWPVSEQRRDECVLSGKDTNGECGNFIRLIEPWNRTHLYVCGTGAYNPICTYINRGRKPLEYIFHLEPGKVDSGKGKCSYDPKLNSVSALINGELYAGVYIDFMGTDAAIFRTMGTQTAMRTDQYNSRWLNDPAFVHAQLIPDSAEKNDDKLYFFFREKSSDAGQSPVAHSRIGRICLVDGELYAGVYIDFMGTDAAIFRTMGTQTAMRTDQYNSRWLNDPAFVHAQLIPDSAEKNDDKLYFFFREKSSDAGQSPVAHSRIGRICLVDGELYAGVYIDFMGTDAAIFRTMGTQTAMRTDQYNSRWLNDPAFVHAQLIPDSAEKNDDKLYFFFREKSSDAGQSPVAHSRIGRICLNDDGGHCCLVNKWSSFLKARLICSVSGPDGIETHFDELRK
ncbi:UNVERIFIED_CONTAM: hypothetical protein FKN15_054872, partial [Acipenser sinensis]